MSATIESIIRRTGGTTVTLGGTEYRFLPDDNDRHTAVVNNPDHIGQLLAIREGYRLVIDAEPAAVPEPAIPVPADPVDAPATDNEPAPDDSVQPDTLGPDQSGDGDDSQGDDTSDAEPADDDKELDREALAVEFEKKFGNRPHGRWSADRIRDELAGE